MLKALIQSPGKQTFCIEEALGLKQSISFIYGEIAAAILSKDIDIESIEFMFRSIEYSLLDYCKSTNTLNIRMWICATEQFPEN